MSLPVALQSVLFYVVACTPCGQVRHRKKAKVQAKKERLQKAKTEAEQPDLYRHPDPFSTNPYWDEEIMMGPTLPKKGKVRADINNKSERGLASAGVDSGIGTRSSLAISNAGTKDSTKDKDAPTPKEPRGHTPESEPTAVASSSEEPSSPTLTQTASVSTRDDWNLQRYQREDEELWGHELSRTGQKLMDAIKQASTSAGRFVEAKLGMEMKEKEKQITDEDRHNFYFTPRNPPVNDHHPPVVSSKPAHRDGHRWMIQPPPSAKVMEGKVPVSRSTSMTSMASSRRTAAGAIDGQGLSRLVGERLVEAKIRRGETPDEARSRSMSTSTVTKPLTRKTTGGASSARSRSQRTVRSRSHSLSTESEPETLQTDGKPRKSRISRVRPTPVATPQNESDADEEDEWVSRSLESLSKAQIPSHAAQRPRLSTILSSDQTGTGTGAMPLQNVSNKTAAAPTKPTVEKPLEELAGEDAAEDGAMTAPARVPEPQAAF
ncbi:hypothetical protein GE09DRAFT_170337 [Coniochaeta sp. 2T2.1]|nr:hypothetical protein GE09DRAFT_170337 [Coniochaeta sp. 2T2.1]